jgi:hypothetical protein
MDKQKPPRLMREGLERGSDARGAYFIGFALAAFAFLTFFTAFFL